MSHTVDLSITDCQHIVQIRERLENEADSEEDEREIYPWITTLASIIVQAVGDGFNPEEGL